MSSYMSEAAGPGRDAAYNRNQRMGRQIGQQANPFQQQPGQDNNVEQQALSQAIQGPQQQSSMVTAAPQRNYSQQGGDLFSGAGGGLPGQSGQINIPQGMAQPQQGGGNLFDAFGPQFGPQQPQTQARPQTPQNWNTDGYATPQHTAQNFGQAPSGWDPQKWNDPNHQTPKYVSGRLAMEAGDLSKPENRQKYLDGMKQAYGDANFKFNGKDKISIDGGRSWVDVFGGASAGIYSPAWQDESQQGGGAPQGTMGGFNPQLPLNMAINGPQKNYAAAVGAPAGDGGGVDPFAAMGGGVRLPNGDWVPKDHPAARGAAPAQGAPGGGPGPTATTDPAIYTPGALPGTTAGDYQKYKFQRNAPQFNAPDQSGIEGQQQAILQRILANPETMNSQVVSQLKERGKEEALAMQKQLSEQLGQNAAGRGLGGGGFENSNLRRLGESTMQSILSGNRDVDLEKFARDRADQLGALGAADSVLGNQMNRRTQGYDASLRGAMADFDQQRSEAEEGRFGWQAGMDKDRFALDRALAGEDLKQRGADSIFSREMGRGDLAARNRGLDIQDYLGREGINVDRQRISEGGRQFDLSHDLAIKDLMERMRQFNGNLGYNYNALNQSGQQSMINQILGMF